MHESTTVEHSNFIETFNLSPEAVEHEFNVHLSEDLPTNKSSEEARIRSDKRF